MKPFLLILLLGIAPLKWASAEPTHRHSDSEHTTHHDHEDSDRDDKDRHEEDAKEKPTEVEPTAGGVGPGKAVLEASPENGMRLSEKAITTLGLKFRKIEKPLPLVISFSGPTSPIVYHQAETGVYRLRDGWIKLIDVEILKSSPGKVTIQSRELKPGDQFVAEGASLLRVTELDVTSGGGDHD